MQDKIYELNQKRDELKSKLRLAENLSIRINEIEKDLQKTIENKNLLESKSPVRQDTEELEKRLSKLQAFYTIFKKIYLVINDTKFFI